MLLKKILIILILITSNLLFGQDIQRQMISVQGNSITLANGMYVSQSIGQQSIIGSSLQNKFAFSQGYQKNLWNNYIKSNDSSSIRITAYPNPFIDAVNFKFSKTIVIPVQTTLFDITGKTVYQTTQLPIEKILTLSNLQLPHANYLVRLTAGKFNYYTKIIQSK